MNTSLVCGRANYWKMPAGTIDRAKRTSKLQAGGKPADGRSLMCR
jgi:hypothetical protein